jgi:hypothetical protein
MTRRVLMIIAVLTLMTGLAARSQADLAHDPYFFTTDVVKFYVVDWGYKNFDLKVVLDAYNSNGLRNLQYSLDNQIWQYFDQSQGIVGRFIGSATISLTDDYTQLVYLKSGSDQSGAMVFSHYITNSGSYTNPQDLELYDDLLVYFGGVRFSILTAKGTDAVAPVPIPAAVWLFAPALAGLVGLRRRFTK